MFLKSVRTVFFVAFRIHTESELVIPGTSENQLVLLLLLPEEEKKKSPPSPYPVEPIRTLGNGGERPKVVPISSTSTPGRGRCATKLWFCFFYRLDLGNGWQAASHAPTRWRILT